MANQGSNANWVRSNIDFFNKGQYYSHSYMSIKLIGYFALDKQIFLSLSVLN